MFLLKSKVWPYWWCHRWYCDKDDAPYQQDITSSHLQVRHIHVIIMFIEKWVRLCSGVSLDETKFLERYPCGVGAPPVGSIFEHVPNVWGCVDIGKISYLPRKWRCEITEITEKTPKFPFVFSKVPLVSYEIREVQRSFRGDAPPPPLGREGQLIRSIFVFVPCLWQPFHDDALCRALPRRKRRHTRMW